MFNGYDQVAGLYAGMDLHKYYDICDSAQRTADLRIDFL